MSTKTRTKSKKPNAAVMPATRFENADDYPYAYSLKGTAIYKSLKKPDGETIFPDLPTAKMHLLPRLAQDLQPLLSFEGKSYETAEAAADKSFTKFKRSYLASQEEILTDKTFLVQGIDQPDAIVAEIYDKLLKIGMRNASFIDIDGMVVYRRSEGFVVGFTDAQVTEQPQYDFAYLFYKIGRHVALFNGSEDHNEPLGKAYAQYLAEVEHKLDNNENSSYTR